MIEMTNEISQNGKKRIPKQMNVDTLTLYRKLLELKENDFISYQELNESIKRNVQKDANPCLQSARRRLLNQDSIVTEAVRNEGIKKVDGAELNAVGESAIKGMRKKARLAFKKLSTNTQFEEMAQETKDRFNALQTVSAFVGEITRPKSVDKIENRVKQTHEILPTQKTLELFKNKE